MHGMGEERREFQRLNLDPPLQGTFGDQPVVIAEMGVLGAGIRHDQPLATKQAELRTTYGDASIAMRCEVVRSVNGVYSGLRFTAAVGDSGDHLRRMLGDLVLKAFEGRREAPTGPIDIIDGDRTVRGTDAKFLSYRFESGIWSKRRVFLPEQPAVGFTVARGEDSEEMQRLCRVYAASDDEGRRLIRLFAELSVSDALEIPPRT
ncbi:MAG TPA: hypothetical protein VF111_06075 [Thermoanaerobaculia bacterium]